VCINGANLPLLIYHVAVAFNVSACISVAVFNVAIFTISESYSLALFTIFGILLMHCGFLKLPSAK